MAVRSIRSYDLVKQGVCRDAEGAASVRMGVAGREEHSQLCVAPILLLTCPEYADSSDRELSYRAPFCLASAVARI